MVEVMLPIIQEQTPTLEINNRNETRSAMDTKQVTSKVVADKSLVVNVAKLDAKTPIPLETGGAGYTTKKGRKYVPFFDNGDNFFQLLLEASLLSPTNLSCLNSKTKFTFGRGFMYKDKKDYPEFTAWAKKVNKKGESLNDILKSVINARYTCGNNFIEVVRSKKGKTKEVRLFHRNFVDCRLDMPEDEDDIPTMVYVSKQFRKKNVWNLTDDQLYVEIPLYTGGGKDQEWFVDENGNEHCMIHLKNSVAGYDYYGMPSNVASLPQQILEYKIARYNLDNFDNNLVIGGVIVLQGNMTKEEAKKFGREVTVTHSGDGNRGKYVILSSESGVGETKILNFDQTKDYDFIEGDKRVEEKIFLSNEWSKVLIDPQSSGLGNSGKQIREIYETKYNTVIQPEQTFIIEKFLQPVMDIIAEFMPERKAWTDIPFAFDNIPVLGIANDIDVNAVLTKDEGRAALGYEATEDGTGKQTIKSSTQLNLFSNAQS